MLGMVSLLPRMLNIIAVYISLQAFVVSSSLFSQCSNFLPDPNMYPYQQVSTPQLTLSVCLMKCSLTSLIFHWCHFSWLGYIFFPILSRIPAALTGKLCFSNPMDHTLVFHSPPCQAKSGTSGCSYCSLER